MNNADKMVSIIIPAWNVENYIFRAIESCIGQAYCNIEIIVVDDGSTDKTIEIVEKYQEKDSRIHIIKQNHEGVSAARNLGIRKAKGTYAVFLDSDDWMTEETIAVLVEYSKKNPNYLVGGDTAFIEEGNEKNGIEHTENQFEVIKLSQHSALMYTDTTVYRNASVQYKLFEIDIIRKEKIYFDTEILYGEDGLFVYEYLNHVKGMVYLDVCIWNYLVRKNSSTRVIYNEKFITSLDAVERMIEYPGEHSEDIDSMLKAYAVTKALNMFRRYVEAGENKIEIPKKYKNYIRKYKRAYAKRTSIGQIVRMWGILYIPYCIYAKIYRMSH